MDKIKRITPEQYRTLAQLKMPIFAYPLDGFGRYTGNDLISQLKNPVIQAEEHRNYEAFLTGLGETEWAYWTLVQAD